MLHHEDAPAFVAASAITIGTDNSVPEIPGPPSLMLFVKVLDPGALENLARDFALPDAHIARTPGPADTAQLLLDELTLEALAWRPQTPGQDLRKFLLPLLAVALLVLGILALAVLRHALMMLRAQESQYASLLAHRKALERSEERFRDIAEVSSDWLWEVDATGTLTYLSERFEQVTGFSPTEWLGKPLHRLLHPMAARSRLPNGCSAVPTASARRRCCASTPRATSASALANCRYGPSKPAPWVSRHRHRHHRRIAGTGPDQAPFPA
ncbi:PAS domain S-box protein [Pseudomonas sp. NA13]